METGSDNAELVNMQFDCDLQRQIDGTLPVGYVYKLGCPGPVLLAAGLDDLPMELESGTLNTKSDARYRRPHPFDLSELKGLPIAINTPIAVFRSTRQDSAMVILTELKHGNDNFVAVIKVRMGKGRINIGVNNITSVYPKNRVDEILRWFKSGDRLITWVDKEKALQYVSTQSPQYIVGGDPEGFIKSVKEVIQNFLNPIF